MIIEPGGKSAHCREGRDRTGYMMAYAEKRLEGLTPQQAFAEEEAHGYNPYKQQKYLVLTQELTNVSQVCNGANG